MGVLGSPERSSPQYGHLLKDLGAPPAAGAGAGAGGAWGCCCCWTCGDGLPQLPQNL